ncbi:hypothetical protein AYI69_g921 [Smittium culicis]|uniref:Uncharacterized protein n=1 Tax=Smittium culicis TaxID=133412 RepID=A0A1R1YRR4_9FUNG|nr:hypothetical protein AYI69_g921 [Smittium culicis]
MRPAIVGILERFEIINENTSSDENDEISGDSGSSKETDEEFSENDVFSHYEDVEDLSAKPNVEASGNRLSTKARNQPASSIYPLQ